MPEEAAVPLDRSQEARQDSVPELTDQLRITRSKLRTVMKLMEDIVIVLDRTGLVVDISSRAEEVLGISLDDVIGRTRWEDFVPEDEKERLAGYFNDRTSGIGNPPSTYTFRVLVPGGQRFVRASVDFISGTEDRVVVLKDLSEVVKEQKRTAESEERYRTVIENTMDGILICTIDRILFANSSFCDMTGIPREEVYTLTPMRFFQESDRVRLETIFTESSGEGKTIHVLEAGLRKRDGFIPAEISATPMVYRGIEAVLISIRDLSMRREAEKRLKEQHKLLKAIVDNSPVGVSVHDRYGTLLMANASWMAIWGKSGEGDSYLGHFISDVELVYRQGGELYIPILRIPNPPRGAAEFISHHFYALMDDEGAVDKVVILTLDLTESLRTKDELKETRDQYRELFNNIPVAVYRTTLESGGSILSANPEMVRMFHGSNLDELMNVAVKDLYVDPARRRDLMARLADDEEVQGFEAELRRIDGSTFLGAISARKVLHRGGDPNYIEGIIRDITDQRRMEEELQNVEQLESIGTLAGGIAHDFNNLLMAIQGSISLAREEKEPEKLAAYLEETDGSIQEATVLTRQLLTFARGGVPVREIVDVDSCVREAVLFSMSGSRSEVGFHMDEGLRSISADREQISQVIRNIALNAVQSMSGAGRLTVSACNVSLGAGNEFSLKPGDYIRISIGDDGPGIAHRDLKRIFNPYFTTKTDGTGLGLATSYSIVKRHSGAIRVSSEEGHGAEFVVYLPAADEKEPSKRKRKPAARTVHCEHCRILIMDDDHKVREVLGSMLEALGHAVTGCADGDSAVELYRDGLTSEKPYDAVIMDLTVPGGTGGEAAVNRLREIDPGVRAIVSSGYANNPVLSCYLDYGFSGSLVKPFSLSVLRKELESVLGGRFS